MSGSAEVAVIGIGNDYRHDDAVGLEVARRVRRANVSRAAVVIGVSDDFALHSAWQDRGAAYVIDCTKSGRPPGTIHRFEAADEAIPAEIFNSLSTHTLNLPRAIELSRSLGRLPRGLTIFGIEGADMSQGRGLTAAVEAAASRVAGMIVRRCVGSRHARAVSAD
jgi:hydrogenase maturation protease